MKNYLPHHSIFKKIQANKTQKARETGFLFIYLLRLN